MLILSLFGYRLQILAPFFTPGTLIVYPSTAQIVREEPVPSLAIANRSMGHLFAYSPAIEGDIIGSESQVTKRLYGPRTILTMLEEDSVSSGRILDIVPAHNHSEYRLDFSGPYVKCGAPDKSTIGQIDQALETVMKKLLGTAKPNLNVYYAFVPYFSSDGTLLPQSQPRYQFPAHDATNELWITFLRYFTDPEDGHLKTKRQYLMCDLWNATYHLNLHWEGGIQDVTAYQPPELHNQVKFPNDKPGTVSDMSQHAFSAYAWAIYDSLIGTVSWYIDKECDPTREDNRCSTQFGIINTQLQHSSLIGSADLDVFFNINEETDSKGFLKKSLSAQRLQDKALAKNRTLDVLIEELSFNTTASLLHNHFLT